MGSGREELAEMFSDSLAPQPAPAPRTPPARRLAARARHRAGTGLLAGLAVAGGLLPLYGDPRVTPLTHPHWARMLLGAFELEGAIPPGARASDAFGALAWTESLLLPGARFTSSEGVEVEGGSVRAGSGIGEVRYTLAVVRGGDYRIRCHVQGDPTRPVRAEVGLAAGGASRGFDLDPPAGAAGWVAAGRLYLDPGSYTAAILLPAGTALDYLEVAPPCLRAVEPPEGWRQRAVTSRDDLAVTLLQALDAEHALPPDALPIEMRAADVQVEGSLLEAAAEPEAAAPAIQDLRLEGGSEGLRAVGFVEIPRSGLYTLYAFSTPGAGLSFLADGCSRAVLCPQDGASLAWRPMLTRRFEEGRHHVDVTLGAGARVEGLRLERKRDDVAGYVAALRSLGFDPGPAGPVTRARAGEAVRFLKQRRGEDPALQCGDLPIDPPRPETAPALVAGVPAAVQTGAAAFPSLPPLPLVEPQTPASPVVPVGR